MTVEERFQRIEHVTAGLAEERRKDREEFRALWRDNQRQINELTVRINDLTVKMADTNDRIDRLGERIDQLAQETRDADRKLQERIDALVVAIGNLVVKIDAR